MLTAKEIKIYKSFRKSGGIVILSSTFLILILLFHDVIPIILCWFLMVFSGLGILAGLAHLFDRRPQLIINKEGIYERSYNEFINWNAIEDAYTASFNGQRFICLVLNENHKSKKTHKFKRGLIKLNKKLGAQEFNIPYGLLDVNESRLLELFSIKLQSFTESSNE